MPYGKFKGIPMSKVPPDYLWWLKENTFKGHKARGADAAEVKNYIARNWDRIKPETQNQIP